MGLPISFKMIDLDRPRKLQLGFGVIAEYEQLTGKKIADIKQDSSLSDLMELLWVMLRRDDKELTLEQAVQLVDDYGNDITTIMTTIWEVIGSGFVRPDLKKKNSKKTEIAEVPNEKPPIAILAKNLN